MYYRNPYSHFELILFFCSGTQKRRVQHPLQFGAVLRCTTLSMCGLYLKQGECLIQFLSINMCHLILAPTPTLLSTTVLMGRQCHLQVVEG